MSNQPNPNQPNRRGIRYWLNLALFAIFLGVVLYSVLTLYAIISPSRSTVCCETPQDRGLDYQDVILEAEDGVELKGWYIPSQNGTAVIMLHGYGGNRMGVLNLGEVIAKEGYGVLMYDARASGESGGSMRSLGWQDIDDVASAIDFLQDQPDVEADQIGVYGFSTGAEVALQAIVRYESLQLVISDGAGFATSGDIPTAESTTEALRHATFPFFYLMLGLVTGVEQPEPIRESLGELSERPIFLISTGQGIEKRQAEIFFEGANEPKEHWNIPEASHGGGPNARPQEYPQRVVSFLETHLGR